MPLRVGLIGVGSCGVRRARSLAALAAEGALVFVGLTDADAEHATTVAHTLGTSFYASTVDLLETVDVACIAVPTRDHFLLAEQALMRGCHVFLEWPPTPSLPECEALVRLGEEARGEIGIGSPFPLAALLQRVPPGWTPRLVSLTLHGMPPGSPDVLPWPHRLAGALDLCTTLARTTSLHRVEAEATRGAGVMLQSVAYALRFRNGTYAQVLLHDAPPPPGHPTCHLYVAGPGHAVFADRLDAPLPFGTDPTLPTADAEHLELQAFLAAVARGTAPPRTILDGLQLLRLTERLQQRLR